MPLRRLVVGARAVVAGRGATLGCRRCPVQVRGLASLNVSLQCRRPRSELRVPGLFFGPAVRHFSHVVETPGFGAESITEGTVLEWKVAVGDFVKNGDLIAMIETDKVTVDVNADSDGTVMEIHIPVDETAEVGAALCTLDPNGAPVQAAAKEDAAIKEESAPAAGASPSAASAPAAEATPAAVAAPTAPGASAPGPAIAHSSLDPPDGRDERRVKMTRMRKAIAKNLKNAQDKTAMLTTFQEVDMSGLMQLRKEHKENFEATHGFRLGIMSAFIKASSFALEQIPAINAYIDDKTNEVVYRDFVDISVAAASPKGLVVPVLRNVESMSVAQVEEAMGELGRKARAEELTLDEMSGGTFTISNGGVFGSMLGTPIINFAPQSAILGMHATKNRPVVLKTGEIVVRPIMYLALSYDHRLIDGREAVTFLCMVRDQVEDPRRLLLGI